MRKQITNLATKTSKSPASTLEALGQQLNGCSSVKPIQSVHAQSTAPHSRLSVSVPTQMTANLDSEDSKTVRRQWETESHPSNNHIPASVSQLSLDFVQLQRQNEELKLQLQKQQMMEIQQVVLQNSDLSSSQVVSNSITQNLSVATLVSKPSLHYG
jgi:hypothetical protein